MKSIRQRLTVWLLAGMLAATAVSGVLLYSLIEDSLTRDFDAALVAKAQAISALVLVEPPGTLEIDFSEEMIPSFLRAQSPDYYEVWLEGGGSFARSRSLEARGLPLPADAVALPRVADMTLPDASAGRAVWFTFTPAKDLDDFEEPGAALAPDFELPRLTLMVAQHRDALDRTLHSMLGLIVLMGALLPCLMTLAVWGALRAGLRPLNRLARETQAIDIARLDHRFDVEPMPLELQPIGRRLNELIGRLEASFGQLRATYERERRFSDNVAHDLRTPIAELHSLAEVALMFPQNREMGEKAHRETLAIARQMEKLVEVLLSLARCEAGIEAIQTEPVDLCELTRQTWGLHGKRAAGRELEARIECEGELEVSTSRPLLASVLDNLIANAVEHAPAAGWVRVRTGMEEGRPAVWIENPAPNLSPADMALIFEPFWQKDAARSGSGHHGLGLALVQSQCRALQIDLSVQLSEDSVFQVRLRFA